MAGLSIDLEELAKNLKPFLVSEKNIMKSKMYSLQKAGSLLGVSRQWFYDQEKRGKIKFYKLDEGSKSRVFVNIEQIERAMKPKQEEEV